MLPIPDASATSTSNNVGVSAGAAAAKIVQAFDWAAQSAAGHFAETNDPHRYSRARAVFERAAKDWQGAMISSIVDLGLPMGAQAPTLLPEMRDLVTRTYRARRTLEGMTPVLDNAQVALLDKNTRALINSLHRLVSLQTYGSLRARIVKGALSKDPNAVFVYVGGTAALEGTAVDGETRPRYFCNKVAEFTRDKMALSAQEIIGLTPDKPGFTIFQGGGWGCKHFWVPYFPFPPTAE